MRGVIAAAALTRPGVSATVGGATATGVTAPPTLIPVAIVGPRVARPAPSAAACGVIAEATRLSTGPARGRGAFGTRRAGPPRAIRASGSTNGSVARPTTPRAAPHRATSSTPARWSPPTRQEATATRPGRGPSHAPATAQAYATAVRPASATAPTEAARPTTARPKGAAGSTGPTQTRPLRPGARAGVSLARCGAPEVVAPQEGPTRASVAFSGSTAGEARPPSPVSITPRHESTEIGSRGARVDLRLPQLAKLRVAVPPALLGRFARVRPPLAVRLFPPVMAHRVR